MNIIIGQAATGDKFYLRKGLIKRLWKKIENGSNILMSAPRRIGKTSIMLHLLENSKENYEFIYLITESVNNKNEFYRKLVNELYTKLSTQKKFATYLLKLTTSTQIKSIGPDGVSFEQNKETNYFEEFTTITEQIDLKDIKIILMVDEFAQTVENIMHDEGNSAAIHFLESVREIRINPKISSKIQFVFAGSIGLENIVSQLNTINTINDLYSFKVTPFTNAESIDYIKTIALKDQEYVFTDDVIQYLLELLAWNIPYFINIILDELETICDEKDDFKITNEMVDNAFSASLKNRTYFEYWHTRLRKAYKSNDYNFSKEILNQIATNSGISKAEIINIAVGLNVESKYKDILNSLEYDGYINNLSNTNIYVFNSPLLKKWWFNNVTN